MKSVKFYFSLLLSAVMLSVAAPAMAQDAEVVADEVAVEQVVAIAEEAVEPIAEAEATAAPVSGSQGRDNSSIDDSFSVGKAIGDFVDQAGLRALQRIGALR